MTELDFDELDKAVNDLMKDPGDGSGLVNETTTSQGLSTPTIPDQPVVQMAEPSVPEPEVASVSPLAARRRGKFMDMVRSPSAPLPVAVRREGININTPSNPDQVSAREQQAVASPDQQAPSNQESDSVYAANPEPVNEWPEASEPADIIKNDSPMDDTAEHDTVEPVMEPEVFEPQPDDSSEGVIESENDQPTTDSGPELAEESSDETLTTPEPTEETESSEANVVEQVQPVAEAQSVEDVTPEPSSTPAESPFLPDAKVEKRPLGAAVDSVDPSLPRELSSELTGLDSSDPATSSETPNIFNQAPLAKPAKKSHGWLVLIWILALLTLGACAGAAYFYFTTPR